MSASRTPRDVVLEQIDDLNAGRFEHRVALFTEDATVTLPVPGASAQGRDAILQQSQQLAELHPTARTCVDRVHEHGSVVIIEGRYTELGAHADLPFALMATVENGLCAAWRLYFDTRPFAEMPPRSTEL